MSTPLVDQQPPSTVVNAQSFMGHAGHGSVGPVIGVLSIITILGVIAVMIGRLCSGRRIMGYGQYDIEGWAERKCSSCLDGRIDYPQPRPVATVTSKGGSDENVSGHAAVVTQHEKPPRNSHGNHS